MTLQLLCGLLSPPTLAQLPPTGPQEDLSGVSCCGGRSVSLSLPMQLGLGIEAALRSAGEGRVGMRTGTQVHPHPQAARPCPGDPARPAAAHWSDGKVSLPPAAALPQPKVT